MEYAPFNPEMERLINDEEKERLERALGSYGLVDALLYDTPLQIEHPEDDSWIIKSEN